MAFEICWRLHLTRSIHLVNSKCYHWLKYRGISWKFPITLNDISMNISTHVLPICQVSRWSHSYDMQVNKFHVIVKQKSQDFKFSFCLWINEIWSVNINYHWYLNPAQSNITQHWRTSTKWILLYHDKLGLTAVCFAIA